MKLMFNNKKYNQIEVILNQLDKDTLDKDNIAVLEREWRIFNKRYNILELADIFPEAKETIKQNIEDTLLQLKDAWKKIESSVEHYLRVPEAKSICLATIENIYQNEIYKLEKLLKRFDYQYNVLDRKIDEKEMINIEEIKNSYDLREVVERYGVKLNVKSGKSKMGKCPFHNDKSPSFAVSERLFYCHSCGKSGDLFTFIQEIEKIDFKTALNRLK